MIIAARHPAVVVHVPARSRNERLSFAEVTTPVELRRAKADDVEPSDWISGPREAAARTLRHGGGLWSPYPGMREEDLVAFLRKDPGAPDLSGSFAGTPLATWGRGVPFDCTQHQSRFMRGEPVDVDGSRRVLRDDRAGAGAALAAWLDDRILLVGGAVLRRVRPFMVVRQWGGQEVSYDKGWTDYLDRSRLDVIGGIPASPATHAAAMAIPRAIQCDAARLESWLGLGIDAEIDAEVERVLVNSTSGRFRARAKERADYHRGEGETALADRFDALAWRLRAHELDALTGRAGERDMAGALQDLVEGMRALHHPKSFSEHRDDRLIHALDHLVIPLRAASPEDAAALVSTAP